MTIILIRGVITIIDITINSNINVILILIIMQSSNVSVWLINSNSWRFHKTACTSFHPSKINMDHNHEGLVQMIFLLQLGDFQVPAVHFPLQHWRSSAEKPPQIWGLMWRIDLGQGTHSQGWWGEMQTSLLVEFLGAVRCFFWAEGLAET